MTINLSDSHRNEHFAELIKLTFYLKRSTDYGFDQLHSAERLADVEQALACIDVLMPEYETLPYHATLQKLQVSLEGIRVKILESHYD